MHVGISLFIFFEIHHFPFGFQFHSLEIDYHLANCQQFGLSTRPQFHPNRSVVICSESVNHTLRLKTLLSSLACPTTLVGWFVAMFYLTFYQSMNCQYEDYPPCHCSEWRSRQTTSSRHCLFHCTSLPFSQQLFHAEFLLYPCRCCAWCPFSLTLPSLCLWEAIRCHCHWYHLLLFHPSYQASLF